MSVVCARGARQSGRARLSPAELCLLGRHGAASTFIHTSQRNLPAHHQASSELSTTEVVLTVGVVSIANKASPSKHAYLSITVTLYTCIRKMHPRSLDKRDYRPPASKVYCRALDGATIYHPLPSPLFPRHAAPPHAIHSLCVNLTQRAA